MNTKVILLSGKQGSGKSTLQNSIIAHQHDHETFVHVVNFADPLYQMHNYCLNVLEEHGVKRDIVKDGPLLQLLGTQWGRETIDPDIWVTMLKEKIDRLIYERPAYKSHIFIVGDCRFKNELLGLPEALRVRLECSKEVRRERCSAWRENDTHQSEIDLDDWSDRFDLIYSTEHQSPQFIAHSIHQHLKENNWLHRRKHHEP